MKLKELNLVNFKNFIEQRFEFDDKINCFVGKNGMGKTNVLDAIYHLSYGKSYFNLISSQNIRHGEDFFRIDGYYSNRDRDDKISMTLKRGQKKVIKRNEKPYDRLSDHIGLIPLVIISPTDRDLIIEGSETRRKFLDSVISQNDQAYLRDLIDHNKIISQRNSLLKYFALNNTFDTDTLAVYDEKMIELANPIFDKRKKFLDEFISIFRERYNSISKGSEQVEIKYKSHLLKGALREMLENNLKRDRALQYSSVGIHKDDLIFEIEGHPIKKFGSQGQQKSFLIALKLAQFDFLKANKNTDPILLLDDIFDKLDEERVAQIISLVKEENFGQLFISDTHPERTEQAIQKVHSTYKIFNLTDNK